MGAADTTYLLKKSNRAEEEAVLLATGRDIEYQQLILRFENYRWTLVDRKDSAAVQRDDVPPFLFRLVEFVKAQGGYEGSATAAFDADGRNYTKHHFNKAGSNVAYHCIQRFKTGEVTPELCREHNLTVIEHPSGKTPRSICFAEKQGKPSTFGLIRRSGRMSAL